MKARENAHCFHFCFFALSSESTSAKQEQGGQILNPHPLWEFSGEGESGIISGKISVWDSITGGGRGTGLLP